MKTRTRRFAPSLLAAGASVALAAAAHAAPSPADPTGMADSDMLRVLTAYQKLGARPVASLTVAQARAQPPRWRRCIATGTSSRSSDRA